MPSRLLFAESSYGMEFGAGFERELCARVEHMGISQVRGDVVPDRTGVTPRPRLQMPTLPPELFSVVARYLAAGRHYRTLASLSAVSKDIRYASMPMIRHTILCKAKRNGQAVSMSRFLKDIAHRYSDADGYRNIRFIISATQAVAVTWNELLRVSSTPGIAATAPEITVLFRVTENVNFKSMHAKPGDDLSSNCVVRLGTSYQLMNNELVVFFRKHADMLRHQDDRYYQRRLIMDPVEHLVIIAPANFGDVEYIRRAMSRMDRVLAKSKPHKHRLPIYFLRMLKATDKPYDRDNLYLLTLELLQLCAHHCSGSRQFDDTRPQLDMEGLEISDAEVVLQAVSKAISIKRSYADIKLRMELKAAPSVNTLKRWLLPIITLYEEATSLQRISFSRALNINISLETQISSSSLACVSYVAELGGYAFQMKGVMVSARADN